MCTYDTLAYMMIRKRFGSRIENCSACFSLWKVELSGGEGGDIFPGSCWILVGEESPKLQNEADGESEDR